jgi:inorganic pyrophosphatase
MNLNNTSFINEEFKVIIECLKGSNEKFELDEKDAEIKLDFVFNNLFFPFYYCYIPGTRGGDGDMLDALLISSAQYNRGQSVDCKCIGYAEVIDRGEVDNKFVMVPVNDLQNDISDIPTSEIKVWENFWLEVAKQKNKVMEVKAWHGREKALEEIKNSLE